MAAWCSGFPACAFNTMSILRACACLTCAGSPSVRDEPTRDLKGSRPARVCGVRPDGWFGDVWRCGGAQYWLTSPDDVVMPCWRSASITTSGAWSARAGSCGARSDRVLRTILVIGLIGIGAAYAIRRPFYSLLMYFWLAY